MDRFYERQVALELLNASTMEERLSHLQKLLREEKAAPAVRPQFVNNHIHTTYSFSPYSPTAAIYCARDEGLQTAGIVDHDTIAGALEFREAGKIAGIWTTCGMECRASLAGTRLEGRKLNSADQSGIAYFALHSIPVSQFGRIEEVFAPLREKRNIRNRRMTDNLNSLLVPYEISVDFEQDVLPLSQYINGGTVTERHLLYALSQKLIAKAGKENCADFVENCLGISLSQKQEMQLTDPQNPHFVYDLLGVLKAQLVEKIYIPATDECMSLSRLVKLSEEIGAILCYAYLGDVTNPVTGDRKIEKFEDDFLDELFDVLEEEGVHGVTYMPSRNTKSQLTRVQTLCCKHNMTEISGEDVNSSRQSMICQQLSDPQFHHLVAATWRLIERENHTVSRVRADS